MTDHDHDYAEIDAPVTPTMAEFMRAKVAADLAQRDHAKAVQADAKVTGQRWCSQHQGFADVDGGKFKACGGNVRRWICATCWTKRYATRTNG